MPAERITASALLSLRGHWPEYLMEAWGLGVLMLAAVVAADVMRWPSLHMARFLPGPFWQRAALPFAAEFLASFGVMTLILATGATMRAARYTGLAAAAATFLLGLSDVSAFAGFSLNPARSLVSAVPSGHWDGVWIYLLAPRAGMALAALVNRRVLPLPPMPCAKLVHDNTTRCIHCGSRPSLQAGAVD